MTRRPDADLVMVPRRLLEELATYLEIHGGGEPVVSVLENGEWTERMVEQLRQEISGYRGANATLDIAAERAGEVVSLDEIEQLSGIPRKQIASDLGAMSKAARRLFGRKAWPMRAMQSSAGMNYLMQPEIAAWWRR